MRQEEFQLNIISAEKKVYSGNVSSLVAPGIGGKFGVYPNHAPMITALKKGTLTYMVDGAEQSLEVNGGITEVKDNIVTICIE